MVESHNLPGGLPPPVVAPINEGMYRAAAEGRLALQCCDACGAHRYPPGEGCPGCTGLRWHWTTLPGTGVIYTYTWIPDRHRGDSADRGLCYNVAVVALDGAEGGPVRILANVVDAWDPGDLHVGQVVRFAPVGFADGLAYPCFRCVP